MNNKTLSEKHTLFVCETFMVAGDRNIFRHPFFKNNYSPLHTTYSQKHTKII